MSLGGTIIFNGDSNFCKAKICLNEQWYSTSPYIFNQEDGKWYKSSSTLVPMVNLVTETNDVFCTSSNDDFLVRKEK